MGACTLCFPRCMCQWQGDCGGICIFPYLNSLCSDLILANHAPTKPNQLKSKIKWRKHMTSKVNHFPSRFLHLPHFSFSAIFIVWENASNNLNHHYLHHFQWGYILVELWGLVCKMLSWPSQHYSSCHYDKFFLIHKSSWYRWQPEWTQSREHVVISPFQKRVEYSGGKIQPFFWKSGLFSCSSLGHYLCQQQTCRYLWHDLAALKVKLVWYSMT